MLLAPRTFLVEDENLMYCCFQIFKEKVIKAFAFTSQVPITCLICLYSKNHPELLTLPAAAQNECVQLQCNLVSTFSYVKQQDDNCQPCSGSYCNFLIDFPKKLSQFLSTFVVLYTGFEESSNWKTFTSCPIAFAIFSLPSSFIFFFCVTKKLNRTEFPEEWP